MARSAARRSASRGAWCVAVRSGPLLFFVQLSRCACRLPQFESPSPTCTALPILLRCPQLPRNERGRCTQQYSSRCGFSGPISRSTIFIMNISIVIRFRQLCRVCVARWPCLVCAFRPASGAGPRALLAAPLCVPQRRNKAQISKAGQLRHFFMRYTCRPLRCEVGGGVLNRV